MIPLLRRPISFLESLAEVAPVVRIYLWHRPVYLLTAPELVYRTLVTDGDKFVKGLIFDKVRASIGSGLFTSEGDFHRKQRRLLQPAFYRDRLSEYAETMVNRSIDTVARWQPGRDIDIDSELHKLTRGIVTETLFGTVLTADQDRRLQRAIPRVNVGIALRALYPVEAMGKLPFIGTRALDAAVADLRALCDELIAQSGRAESSGTSLISLLRGGDELTETQVRDEVIAILLGGTETAATTLSWLCYELALRSDLQERIRAEVREVTAGKPIRWTDLPRLDHTRRAVEETLRLHTPNWLLMRRTVQPVDYGDVRLPADSDILFSFTALHRLPTLYQNPAHFDPDRWDDAKQLPRGGFLPFSAGKHKCIGDSFAMAEMTVIAATALARWQLQLAPGARVSELARTTVIPHGLTIRVVPTPPSTVTN